MRDRQDVCLFMLIAVADCSGVDCPFDASMYFLSSPACVRASRTVCLVSGVGAFLCRDECSPGAIAV